MPLLPTYFSNYCHPPIVLTYLPLNYFSLIYLEQAKDICKSKAVKDCLVIVGKWPWDFRVFGFIEFYYE
jgi:hypothetical protein